jgi:antitoxin VapB
VLYFFLTRTQFVIYLIALGKIAVKKKMTKNTPNPLRLITSGIYFQVYIAGGRDMNTAKIFKNGKSQAVRLPKEFKLEGSEVYIKRVGRNVILTPKDNAWDSLINSLNLFTEDFMSERKQPLIQVREEL